MKVCGFLHCYTAMPCQNLESQHLIATVSSFAHSLTTGGGQKLRTSGLVLPVADNIFKWMYFASVSRLLLGLKFETPPIGQISSKTEAKYIHWKMLSATGRTRLPVHSFCPPPVLHSIVCPRSLVRFELCGRSPTFRYYPQITKP